MRKLIVLLLVIAMLNCVADPEATAVLEEEEAVADASSATDTNENETIDLDAVVESEVEEQKIVKDVVEESSPSAKQDTVVKTSDDETVADEATLAQQREQAKLLEEALAQKGPFIDLLGPLMYKLDYIDAERAQITTVNTNDALKGKKVIGLYFSADWCGPCRQFTPELVKFYERMNNRKGKEDQFEIVWVSRCRDFNAFGQYFTHMKWIALPFEEAMGQRGQMLAHKYKAKSIPHLVLLDDEGNLITRDARLKIPQDKTGIGFPWRNPFAQLYMVLVPKQLRLLVKSQINGVTQQVVKVVQATFKLR